MFSFRNYYISSAALRVAEEDSKTEMVDELFTDLAKLASTIECDVRDLTGDNTDADVSADDITEELRVLKELIAFTDYVVSLSNFEVAHNLCEIAYTRKMILKDN